MHTYVGGSRQSYPILTAQSSNEQEHQTLKEKLQSLLKQKEMITQQKEWAAKMQHHFTVSQMR